MDVTNCASSITIVSGAAGRVARRSTLSSGKTIVVNTWIWTNVTNGAVETTTEAFDIAVFC